VEENPDRSALEISLFEVLINFDKRDTIFRNTPALKGLNDFTNLRCIYVIDIDEFSNSNF